MLIVILPAFYWLLYAHVRVGRLWKVSSSRRLFSCGCAAIGNGAMVYFTVSKITINALLLGHVSSSIHLHLKDSLPLGAAVIWNYMSFTCDLSVAWIHLFACFQNLQLRTMSKKERVRCVCDQDLSICSMHNATQL